MTSKRQISFRFYHHYDHHFDYRFELFSINLDCDYFDHRFNRFAITFFNFVLEWRF